MAGRRQIGAPIQDGRRLARRGRESSVGGGRVGELGMGGTGHAFELGARQVAHASWLPSSGLTANQPSVSGYQMS